MLGALLFVCASAKVWRWLGGNEQNPDLWRYPDNWCTPDSPTTANCEPNTDGFPQTKDDDVIIDYTNDKDSACELDNTISDGAKDIFLKSISCLQQGTQVNIKTLNVHITEGVRIEACAGFLVDLGNPRVFEAKNFSIVGNTNVHFSSGNYVAPITIGAGGQLTLDTPNTKFFGKNVDVKEAGTLEMANENANSAMEVRFQHDTNVNNHGGTIRVTGAGTVRLYGDFGQLTGSSAQFTGGTNCILMNLSFALTDLIVDSTLTIQSGGHADNAQVNGRLVSQALVVAPAGAPWRNGVTFDNVRGGGTLVGKFGIGQQKTALHVTSSIGGLSAVELSALTTDTVIFDGQNTVNALTFTGATKLTIPTGSTLSVGAMEVRDAAHLEGEYEIETLRVYTHAAWFIADGAYVTVKKQFESAEKSSTLQLGSVDGATLEIPKGSVAKFRKPFTLDSKIERYRTRSKFVVDGTLEVDLGEVDPIDGFAVTIKNMKVMSRTGYNLTGMTANVRSGHLSLVNDDFTASAVMLSSDQAYFDGKTCFMSLNNVGTSTGNTHVVLNVSNVVVQCPKDCGRLGGDTQGLFNFSQSGNAPPPGLPPPPPLPPQPVAAPESAPPEEPEGPTSGGTSAVLPWIVGIAIGMTIGTVVGASGMFVYSRHAGYQEVSDYRRPQNL